MGLVSRVWMRLACAVALAGLAVGCTSDPELPRGFGDPHPAGEGVCALLADAEVEVALNRPLTGGWGPAAGRPAAREADPSADDRPRADVELPHLGAGQAQAPEVGPGDVPVPGDIGPPDEGLAAEATGDPQPARQAGGVAAGGPRPVLAGMDMCTRTGGEALAAWGLLEGEDAEALFHRYADWHERYTHTTSVGEHEAAWDTRLRTLLVLADERVVAVTLTVPDPPVDDEEAPAYVEDMARDLAARALRRLP